MRSYVKSCIADFAADVKNSIKCNALIIEINITRQLPTGSQGLRQSSCGGRRDERRILSGIRKVMLGLLWVFSSVSKKWNKIFLSSSKTFCMNFCILWRTCSNF